LLIQKCQDFRGSKAFFSAIFEFVQRDISSPILGALSNNRWSGVTNEAWELFCSFCYNIIFIFYYITLYYLKHFYIILFNIKPFCIILYYNILNLSILYHTILYSNQLNHARNLNSTKPMLEKCRNFCQNNFGLFFYSLVLTLFHHGLEIKELFSFKKKNVNLTLWKNQDTQMVKFHVGNKRTRTLNSTLVTWTNKKFEPWYIIISISGTNESISWYIIAVVSIVTCPAQYWTIRFIKAHFLPIFSAWRLLRVLI
jgi:hypothetical protein